MKFNRLKTQKSFWLFSRKITSLLCIIKLEIFLPGEKKNHDWVSSLEKINYFQQFFN